tara:strand:+ start:1297 stop:2694 length:1398 start_codon:yes stop_codon:yes gene_type:complete
MKKKYLWLVFLFFDWLSAASAWFCFNFFRKTYIENYHFELNYKLIYSTIIISVLWVLLYAALGQYKNAYKKYRIKEVTQTISQSLLGIILIFFGLLLDDQINSYQDYYNLVLAIIILHTTLTFLPRIIITSNLVSKIHKGKIGFNTLIIGSRNKAKETLLEIRGLKKSSGYFFKGYISTNGGPDMMTTTGLEKLGDYSDLKQVINSHQIEEVIIATEPKEHEKTNTIINDLADLNVKIKVIADMYSILTGSVKMSSIFGALLIAVNPEILSPWEKITKRIVDVILSTIAIMLLSPIFILLSLIIKSGTKGPIIFKQERIGINGKPFMIYKFRSMFNEAEKDGPQLSSQNDPRITPIGKFMRKTRLDETPQFFNVILGDMALVGPRPERQFYIDKIIAEAPHYKHILKVKPGITSWGQVKFGYAENVEEMVARLKFDLLYVENMSLVLDLKILFYTAIIMIKGDGK